MKSFFQETRSLATGFVLGALVLGGGSIALAAWTAPTGAPPTSNIALPVNTSSTTQYKGGALGIGGLLKAYLGIDANSQRITAVATPTDGTDAVNKDYVDAFAQGGGGTAGAGIVYVASKSQYGGNEPTYSKMSAVCAGDYGSGWRAAIYGESTSQPISSLVTTYGIETQGQGTPQDTFDRNGVLYAPSQVKLWYGRGGYECIESPLIRYSQYGIYIQGSSPGNCTGHVVCTNW